jgi:hypothetical protein
LENEAQRAADLRRLEKSLPPLPKKLSREHAAWQKKYEKYYSDRVKGLASGAEGQAPLTFDSYIKYQKSLRRVHQGTGFQAEEAEEIVNRLGHENVETNVGLSKEKNPKITPKKGTTKKESQTKFVDALVKDKKYGNVGISNKAREFKDPATIAQDVTADVKEAINKYGGDRYVRRPGMKEFGNQIEVKNLILSYEADRILTVAGQGATPLGMQQYIREVVEEVAQDYPDLKIAVVFR